MSSLSGGDLCLQNVCFQLQMILAPAWKRTADIVRSDAILVPVALAYLFLLVHSLQPDTLALILPGSLKAGLSGQPIAEQGSHMQIPAVLEAMQRRTQQSELSQWEY